MKNNKNMFLLRELEEKDCEIFSDLLFEQFKQEKDKAKILEKRILKCIQSKAITVLIAIEDQVQIKGYIIIHWLQELWADTPEALFSSLYVALNSRKTGIGKALLEAAIQKTKDNHCSRLWLENNRTNPIYNQQFYKKRGWNERLDLAIFEFPLLNTHLSQPTPDGI